MEQSPSHATLQYTEVDFKKKIWKCISCHKTRSTNIL